MIKTGRPVNFLLGQGDESLANLLGGTRGEAGDVVLLAKGYGPRFGLVRDKHLRTGGYGYGDGTRGPIADPRPPPRTPGPGRDPV